MILAAGLLSLFESAAAHRNVLVSSKKRDSFAIPISQFGLGHRVEGTFLERDFSVKGSDLSLAWFGGIPPQFRDRVIMSGYDYGFPRFNASKKVGEVGFGFLDAQFLHG
jgi:hypothetical protein